MKRSTRQAIQAATFLVLALTGAAAGAQTTADQHVQSPVNHPSQPAAKQRDMVVMTDAPPTETVGYYALVIGNSKYGAPIRSLETPGADATAVAKLLHDTYGFQTKVLLDVTRSQIMDEFVNYRKILSENSKLLIYYAGHGFLDTAVDEAYWLPVDARRDNNNNWISADDITRAVRGIAAKHILVISDSCYSGAILGDETTGRRGLREMSGGLPTEYVAYLTKMETLTSKDWMASGSREPVSDIGAPGHSVFAAALLQGLTEMKDSRFSASDLFYSYVKRKVAGSSEQLPQYGSIRMSGDQLGDFIFSRTGAAPQELLIAAGPVPDVNSNKTADNRMNVDTYDERSRINAISDQDKAAIQKTLDRYAEIFTKRKAKSVKDIWPSVTAGTVNTIQSVIDSNKNLAVSITPQKWEVFGTGIMVTCHQSQSFERNGKPMSENGVINVYMVKSQGNWIISDIPPSSD
jgi:hypothetical protein